MAKVEKTMTLGSEAVAFAEVTEPGTYCVEKSGQLARIPPDALSPGQGPWVSFSGTRPMYVYKLSDDPWMPIAKAREVAREFGLAVRF